MVGERLVALCRRPGGRQLALQWHVPVNGMYRWFVHVVPSEDVLQINGSPEDRQGTQPR